MYQEMFFFNFGDGN